MQNSEEEEQAENKAAGTGLRWEGIGLCLDHEQPGIGH
jgi:hypothetical protein